MFRLSIPIKVMCAAGLAYLATQGLTLWATLHFELDLSRAFWSVRLGLIFLIVRYFAAAVTAVVYSHFLLDRPLIRLTKAIHKVGEGDLLIRVPEEGKDEISLIGSKFNKMLSRISDLSSHKIQTEHDLILAREELKFKKQLEEKNYLISRANRALENLVTDLSLLYEIGQGINQTVEVEKLYQVITEVLQNHLKLEHFSLMVWNERHEHLEVKAAFGFEDDKKVLEMTFKGGEGIAGYVLKKGKPLTVGDIRHDPRFTEKSVNAEGSIVAAPLNYKGKTLGVINFGRHKNFAFTEHDNKMLTLVASQVALAVANAKLYTQTRELSVTDELTGVYNRRHFGQVLQLEWKRAVRFKRDLSLLMVDVDFFKRYNDTYGHLEGDKVLRKMGNVLNQNLREVDTVARFGGEEFVILLPDTDKRGALAVAEKLRHLIQEKIAGITASVGVANYPEDVEEMDDLVDDADIALYNAKDSGRNQVVTYQSDRKSGLLKKPQEPKEEPGQKTRVVH